MSREGRLVITAEIDVRQLAGMTPEQSVKHVINIVRTKADEECAHAGARLRTDRPPDLSIKKGTHNALGLEFLLVWSNWYVDVPESVRLETVELP